MELTGLEFRKVVGTFATGVTVATTSHEDVPYGMTVSAFCSVSLEPLLVLICIEHNASMHDVLLASQRFAVSVLSEQQEHLSRFFADRDRQRGIAGFGDVAFHTAETGSPILDDALAFIDCDVEASYPGGDHTIFVGRVRAIGASEGAGPLIYWRSGYRQLVRNWD